ncbi:hypothetical protein [Kitasatospora phosalacinea]|uniref:Lipoprotein n=1 Tax=Kitasatospora phosalacinea TaxID=2065 RepID=A0ABW6GLE7_9ACTN
MDRLLRTSPLTVAVLAAVLAAGGCQGGSGGAGGGTSDRAREIRRALDDARSQGADQSQIALLEKGEPTFESYQEAVNRSIDCVRRAGIEVVNNGISDSRGFPMVDVGYAAQAEGQSEEQTRALIDDCLLRYDQWISSLYQTGPAALTGMDRQFESIRPAYLACLRKYGLKVDDKASRQEAENAEVQLWHDHPGLDCHSEAKAG